MSFRGIQNHNIATKENGDSLQIFNKTDGKILFVKTSLSVVKLLILEMLPNSSKTVYVNHLKGSPYITVEGEFVDGKKIELKGVNFSEKSKREKIGNLKYNILIQKDKVLIEDSDSESKEIISK